VVSKLDPIVYLPIEFGSREFNSKALLATTLAVRGYSVAIGLQRNLLHYLKFLPPGAILFKSFNSFYHLSMRMGRKYGYRVAILEEELLAHLKKQAIGNFCKHEAFELAHEIYSNGEHEKQVLSELSAGIVPIHVTGNGRVDLLKPKYRAFFKREIETIRARFGDFILVNTNFGIANSMWGPDRVRAVFIETGFLRPEDPESVKSWDERVAWEDSNKTAILAAIEELCRRRPDQKIVVRPHPNEDLKCWVGLFDAAPNVSVVREGSHLPWTLAAQMLVHTSCTTGFEAHVAGKTAMSLVAKTSWVSESFISNLLNPVFSDAREMVDVIESVLDGGAPPRGRLGVSEAERYVWNIGANSGVERIADLLTRDLPSPTGVVSFPRLPPSPVSQEQKSKFGLSFEDCADVFARLIPIVGGERRLRFDDVGNNVFYLSPA
jgi:surface carbohydrate biosynthesis protein